MLFSTHPALRRRSPGLRRYPRKSPARERAWTLAAQVPRGKKETAQMEISVAKDVEPGIHRFRIQTPLGTSNMAVIAIGSLPEINASGKSSEGSAAQPQRVELPATLVGTIAAPGDTHDYSFEGKAGEELVFQVVASPIGSKLQSLLVLRDSSGKVLAEAGENDNQPGCRTQLQTAGARRLYRVHRRSGEGRREGSFLSCECRASSLYHRRLSARRACREAGASIGKRSKPRRLSSSRCPSAEMGRRLDDATGRDQERSRIRR